MTQNWCRISVAVVLVLTMAGCAKSAHQTGQDLIDTVIPADVRAQVDPSVTFTELRSSPDTYLGRTVMYSGLAMKSQRVKDHTEIEVMQIPTAAGLSPSDRRSQSEGRFIAMKTGQFYDPAIIEKGSPLTIVGEVKGSTTRALDEGDYVYPVLEIKHLVDWSEVSSREQGYPSSYRDGGYGYGGYGGYGPYAPWYYGYGPSYWGPYGVYPYSYFPLFVPVAPPPPPPPPPPPSSVPPQFRRGR